MVSFHNTNNANYGEVGVKFLLSFHFTKKAKVHIHYMLSKQKQLYIEFQLGKLLTKQIQWQPVVP